MRVRIRNRPLETRRLAPVRQTLDQISKQWDSAVARLRVFVERP
jgi:hypothetical protein